MEIIEMATDVDMAEVHQSATLWESVESLTGAFDGFVSFMHAIDWLNVTKAETGLVRQFLDGQFGEPMSILRKRMEPHAVRAKQDDMDAFVALLGRARTLIAEEGFTNWQITFPGVWQDWRNGERQGGFDAVVGNPPWDRIKLQQVECRSRRRGV